MMQVAPVQSVYGEFRIIFMLKSRSLCGKGREQEDAFEADTNSTVWMVLMSENDPSYVWLAVLALQASCETDDCGSFKWKLNLVSAYIAIATWGNVIWYFLSEAIPRSNPLG